MRYVARRIGFYAVTLWVSVTLNFLLPRLMPGNPVDYFIMRYKGQVKANPHMLDALRAMLGAPHESWLAQYVSYLGNLAHLDFGVSYSLFPARVSDVLATALPWTLLLAGGATVLAAVLGTLLGILVSWRRGGLLDTLLTPLTMFISAFPAFFGAMLLLYAFGFVAGWFPLQHAYAPDVVRPGLNGPFIGDVADHAALPLLAFLLYNIGGWLLGMRSVMINTLSEDFVTMAEAKGLSERRIMLSYAARNALLPQITSFAIALGYVVTGLLLIEFVFSYPGVGYMLITAVQSNDYPLMQALFLLITVVLLGANLIADLLYARLDPRVRAS